jgi:O-antigen/teichoic acid export membrane protein
MSAQLKRNFVLLAASNLLTPVFSMVLVLAITRLQGVDQLGKYSLMMTLFIVGQSCVGLGLPVLITREVARRPADAGRYFVSACALTAAIAVALLGIALAVVLRSPDAELRGALALVLAALLPSIATTHAEAVLLAFERAGDFVAINFAETTARALIGAAIVFAGGGIVALAVSLLALRILAAAAFAAMLRRRAVALRGGLDLGLCVRLARDVPVLGAIPVVNALYARADVFLLTWFGTWTELGLYSAALRLVDVARTIAPAYARALYPVLARLRTESDAAFAAQVRRSMREVMLLMLPVVLGMAAFAPTVIGALYGARLVDAAPVLRVLAWSVVATSCAATLAQILFAAGLQAVDLRVNVLATVFVALVGAVGVPRFGAAGAAYAVLASTMLYAGLQYAFVRRAVVDPALGPFVAKLGAVALIGALAMRCAPAAPTIAAGAVAVAAYAATIWATRMLGRDDVARLAEFFTWTRTAPDVR